ncbi:hypothetical protein SO802_009482 [Lithocarpus litseifolius]|uniref:Uncharacterized protein n=1 Tax=Lithocarpus litseifolius TaxID=425828 RepID=A0AAW2DBI7_9ROSI
MRYIIDPNIVAPPNQMAWAMHLLGELRRNRRMKLKKAHVKTGLTREQVLASHPSTVMKAQWIEMVDYWFNQKSVTLSEKNKASRDKQEEISRSGAKSLAQISDEMAKAKGSAVERAEVYQQVYRTKDGVPISTHAEENMNRMTELLNDSSIRLQGEIGRGILWSNDDVYARVMGRPERPGRVRGLKEQVAQSDARHREELAQSEARHREELAQSEARHQQQMAGVMKTVRDMINQISQGARDVSSQFYHEVDNGNK